MLKYYIILLTLCASCASSRIHLEKTEEDPTVSISPKTDDMEIWRERGEIYIKHCDAMFILPDHPHGEAVYSPHHKNPKVKYKFEYHLSGLDYYKVKSFKTLKHHQGYIEMSYRWDYKTFTVKVYE